MLNKFENTKENISKGFMFFIRELKYLCVTLWALLASVFSSTNDIEIYSIDKKNEGFVQLNMLGEIDSRDKLFLENVMEEIYKKCPAISSLTYIDLPKDETFEASLSAKNMINLAWHKDIIIDNNGEKVGVSFYDDREQHSFYSMIKRRHLLKKKGATATVAYIRRDKNNYSEHKRLAKQIARTGYNSAVGTGSGLGLKRSVRALNFSSTHILYSIGRITNKVNKEKAYRPFPIIKVGLDTKHKKLAQLSYYVAVALYENSNFYIGEFPENLGIEDLEYQANHKIRNTIKGINRCGQEIYLRDIFTAINQTIPEKYEHMLDYTVNKICSRTMEVAPGNVFFYRQQFRDKNDKDVQNETFRLKLIFRVLLRNVLFIISYRDLGSWVPHVRVDDSIEAHISAIAMLKERMNTKFIGITGSVGKTSTKDMLFEVFNQMYKTEKSLQNSNVQIKIGLNVQNVKDDTEFFIQEIGGGRPGGASRHSRMISPTAVIVTNIGTAHIGNYESQEDLMYNKLGISEGLTEGGTMFLNGDDELLFNADLTRFNCNVCYFAINNTKADYYAENIVEYDNKTEFDIVSGDHRVRAVVNVLGWHNVLNAVCSYAVGQHYGISDVQIIKGLANFKTSGIRQNMVNVVGYQLFVDCFNASATSVETTLYTLGKSNISPENKKVAIIGDITGMGDKLDDINKVVASIINEHKNSYDQLVLYGQNGTDIIKGINDTSNVLIINSREKLTEWVENNIHKGDITLFKGSSKMQLDEIIDDVYGTNLADARYIEEAHYKYKTKNGIKYMVFESYATVRKIVDRQTVVNTGDAINGKKVKKIQTKCFSGNNIVESVSLGKDVLHIGSKCFSNCNKLKEVKHSGTVKYIGADAFFNCRSLKHFDMPKSIKVIGPDAFKNCTALEEARIPGSCLTICNGTFRGCSNLKEVVIEDGVEEIYYSAFKGCSSLETVRIPASVKFIKRGAFAQCENLRTVYVGKNTKVSSMAFRNNKNVEIVRE